MSTSGIIAQISDTTELVGLFFGVGADCCVGLLNGVAVVDFWIFE